MTYSLPYLYVWRYEITKPLFVQTCALHPIPNRTLACNLLEGKNEFSSILEA